MKHYRLLIFVCLVFFTAVSLAFTADDSDFIEVKANLSQTTAHIGDLVKYEIKVIHDKDIQLLTPPTIKPKGFKVRSTQDLERTETRNIVTEGRIFTISTLEAGDYTFDEVTIQYLDEAGIKKTVSGPRLKLKIESVLKNVNEKTDIKDIKGVIGIDPRYEKYLKYIYITIAIPILILILLWLRKKLKKKAPTIRHLLTPEEEALKALGELQNSSLLKKGLIKFYYIDLTDVIRHFLARKFGVNTEELTTPETIAEIQKINISDKHKKTVITFFEDCDLVKFAKYIPAPETIELDHVRAEDIVKQFGATMKAEKPALEEVK